MKFGFINQIRSNNAFQSIFFLLRLISKKDKIRIIYLLFASVIVGLFEVLTVSSIGPILDIISSNFIKQEFLLIDISQFSQKTLILYGGICFSSLIALTSLIKIKTLAYGHFLAADIGQILGKKVLNNYLSQNYSNHLRRDTSELINIFNYHLTHAVKLITFVLQLIVASTSGALLLSLIFFTNPFITINIFIIVSLSYFYVGRKYSSRVKKDSETVKDSLDELTQIIQSISNNIENVILEYNDSNIINNFNKYDKRLRLASSRIQNYGLLPRYIIEGITLTSISLIVLIYSFFSSNQSLNLIATLGTITFGLQRLLPSINLTYQAWTAINVCSPSVKAIKNLITYINIENNRINKEKQKIIKFKKSLQISDITHFYKNKPSKIFLKNKTFTINKGDKVLLKGPSGSGKSTLANIINSLIKPVKGSIIIDGEKLKGDLSISQWRRQISYVKQKPYIPPGNILSSILGEDINYINKSVLIEKAKNFAKIACIDEFIEELPHNYMETIEEGGKQFSGGQIQRISIAKALAKNPSLLILDEATSGLDKKTESKIFNNLMNIENITIFVISHSKNVESLFEKIIDLGKD